MPKKFKHKYRIASARLPHWDYGRNASYFVSICTANRQHFFGNVFQGAMQCSEIGHIAQKFWEEIPKHFPFVILDAFVVMPNHLHGIIVIDKPENNTSDKTVDDGSGDDDTGLTATVETPKLGVSTAAASRKWKPQTLGVIINQYKRVVTIHARKINANFAWQPRYHDHIIRNTKSYTNIKNYIINNPINWDNDKFNQISKE